MKSKIFNYGLFVSGVTIAVYCGGLLALKYVLGLDMTLTRGFFLLTLPPFWFYVSSEVQSGVEKPHAPARHAATILWSGVLAFYLLPILFTILIFPNYQPTASHYFLYAPVALISGFVLIRLHALGGQALLVLAGVSIEVVGAFFFTTRLIILMLGETPSSSIGKTFELFTLVAAGLSYVFLLGTGEKGFFKLVLIRIGHIGEELWQMVRILLIALCLTGSHVLFLISATHPAGQQYIGIILLLLAGLWWYVGHTFHQIIFYSLAYAEVLAALFSCRVFDAIWTESWIIWLLLAFFGTIILIYGQFLQHRYPGAAFHVYAWLSVTAALIVFEHITFYGLSSKLSLVPLFLLWIMVFCIPAPLSSRQFPGFRAFLGILLYVPAFLFFFQQGPPSFLHLPRTLLTAVIISALIVAYRVYRWQWFSDEDVKNPRLIHHLHWYLEQPHSLLFILSLSTLGVAAIHFVSFLSGPDLFARQFLSMLVVQGFLTVYWFGLARKEHRWWWTLTAEMMVAGIIFTLRQDLPLLFHLPWNVNWDLAVGVFVAFAITAARPFLTTGFLCPSPDPVHAIWPADHYNVVCVGL